MRQDIQVFRGLAVFAVLLFHLDRELVPNGYLGVDFFFVISGYLVCPMIFPIISLPGSKRGAFLKDFFVRRFWRLAPTLVAVILISTILMFLLAPITTHETYASQALYTFALMGNFGASKLSPDYFNSYSNPLIHTWSLAIEEQFYLLLPLIIILLLYFSRNTRLCRRNFVLYSLVIVGILSFISFIYADFLNRSISTNINMLSPNQHYYSLSHRFWQLIFGGLLGLKILKSESPISKLPNLFISMLLFSMIAVFIFPVPIDSTLATTYVTFVSGALVFLGLERQSPSNWLWKLGKWMGNISYPLYLLHVPLIFLAKFSPILGAGDGLSRAIPVVICIPVIFLGAQVLHTRVESKFRDRQDK